MSVAMEWVRLRGGPCDGQAAEAPVDQGDMWRYDSAGDWYALYERVVGERTFVFASAFRTREELAELVCAAGGVATIHFDRESTR